MQWGAWGGSGMAASSPATLARLRRLGLEALPPSRGLQALSNLLGSLQRLHAGVHPQQAYACPPAAVAGAAFIWASFLADGREHMPLYAEFRGDARPATQPVPAPGAAVSVPAQQHGGQAAASRAEVPWPGLSGSSRSEWVVSTVHAAITKIVGHALGASKPFMAAGLDSLGMQPAAQKPCTQPAATVLSSVFPWIPMMRTSSHEQQTACLPLHVCMWLMLVVILWLRSCGPEKRALQPNRLGPAPNSSV